MCFDDVTFDVGRGERLLILGLNGAGKTSLLRILAGTSEPDIGRIHFGHNVSTGYYAQEHEGITAGRSVLAHMQEQIGDRLGDEELRRILGMFALTGEKAIKMHRRSPAERRPSSRSHNSSWSQQPAAARRTHEQPRPRLTRRHRGGTRGWPGTMVIVSHDTDFVRQLAPDRVLMMPEGDLDYWRDELIDLVGSRLTRIETQFLPHSLKP